MKATAFMLLATMLPVVAYPDDPTPADGPQPVVVLPAGCEERITLAAVPVITDKTLYMFETDKEVLATSSPLGLLNITREENKPNGSIIVRGVFIGNTRASSRKFTKRFVYTVDPVPDKTGRVELLVIPIGAKFPSEIVRATLDVNAPSPGPGPGPTPPPGPGPAPVPVPSVPMTGIVFIEETESAQAARAQFLSDPAFQARLKDKGIKLRTADKDVVGPTGQPPADLVEYLDKARAKNYPQVFFVGYKDGKRVTLGQFDLPKTMAELIQLMQKYGG